MKEPIPDSGLYPALGFWTTKDIYPITDTYKLVSGYLVVQHSFSF